VQKDSKETIHFREDKALMSEIRKELSVRAGIVRRGVFTNGMHEAMRVYLGLLKAQNKEEKTIISFQNQAIPRSQYRDAIQLREDIIRYMVGRGHWKTILAPPAVPRISLLQLREAIGILRRQKSRTDGTANWKTIDVHIRKLKRCGVIKDDGKINSLLFCNPENTDDEGLVASMVERQYEIVQAQPQPQPHKLREVSKKALEKFEAREAPMSTEA
jgi:hypothetical protein